MSAIIRSMNSMNKKIFVSNIPSELQRLDKLEELFENEVGEVSSVVYYKNENDTFQGCITIEFIRVESVQLAIDKMNNFDMNGNELVVEEDNVERDNFGHPLPKISSSCESDKDKFPDLQGCLPGTVNNLGRIKDPDYAQIFKSISGQITRIFIANLDPKVTKEKMKTIFNCIGPVWNVEIFTKENEKYGFVEYGWPVDAFQIISVLDARYMYNGPIFIKMYKDVASEDDNENDVAPEDHNENDIVKMFQNRNKAQYHFGNINVLVNESDDDDDDGDEELQRYLALHASKNITPEDDNFDYWSENYSDSHSVENVSVLENDTESISRDSPMELNSVRDTDDNSLEPVPIRNTEPKWWRRFCCF